MAEPIVCPVCGEPNAADMEFCRNCQSRLHPLTGPLKGENAAIQPGQIPTKKVTSELEPILPKWMRDARQQARQSEEEAPSEFSQPGHGAGVPQGGDLLAGLESQAREEDEETPEWLAHITGTSSKKKKSEPESPQVKWVELGHQEPAVPPLNEESPAQQTSPETDELAAWFKQASASTAEGFDQVSSSPAAIDFQGSSDNQDKTDRAFGAEDLQWLQELDANKSAQPAPAEPPAQLESPDWLRNLQTESPSPGATPPFPSPSALPSSEGTPDWLQSLQANEASAEPPAPFAPASPAFTSEETPDWLKKLEAEQPPAEPIASSPAGASDVVMPDWLKNLGDSSVKMGPPDTGPLPQPSVPEAPEQSVPSWLQQDDASGVTPPSSVPAEASPAELPDWIAALGPTPAPEPASHEAPTVPAPSVNLKREEQTPVDPSVPPRAFTPDSMADNDVEAIFASMQTPDWLSAAISEQSGSEANAPAAAQEEEGIGPAELPSWVQAMRPVESAIPSSEAAPQDVTLEERGPLAGLHGVLPSIPGAALPSSKPKAHSIKLDATEQQQSHAALLEQILAAETAPIPMKAGALLKTQRFLRWAIALLLLVVLGSTTFMGTEIFSLPSSVPNETSTAIDAANKIPDGAPVLVVFDYQPSTIGEMEATASPLIDQLLLLKHSHLVLLSTSPTGSAIAERFLALNLTDMANQVKGFQPDVQYVDLGYLPGGLAGVYDFSQNPKSVIPFDITSSPAWGSPVLASINRYSDFPAVIVLTDSPESGRVWIEQTIAARGNSLLIIAASAQAAPMLLPYADSGQVNGLISGIYGAARIEEINGGRPGYVTRYWDAYSAGLYLAALLMLIGGLWNLLRGVQDRRAQVG